MRGRVPSRIPRSRAPSTLAALCAAGFTLAVATNAFGQCLDAPIIAPTGWGSPNQFGAAVATGESSIASSLNVWVTADPAKRRLWIRWNAWGSPWMGWSDWQSTPIDPGASTTFGRSIAVSNEFGSSPCGFPYWTAVVGDPMAWAGIGGAYWVSMRRVGLGGGECNGGFGDEVLQGSLHLPDGDSEQPGDHFGHSVDVGPMGIVVGAPGRNQVFRYAWYNHLPTAVLEPLGSGETRFGEALATDGSWTFVASRTAAPPGSLSSHLGVITITSGNPPHGSSAHLTLPPGFPTVSQIALDGDTALFVSGFDWDGQQVYESRLENGLWTTPQFLMSGRAVDLKGDRLLVSDGGSPAVNPSCTHNSVSHGARLYTRNSQGQWVRSACLDLWGDINPVAGSASWMNPLALLGDHAFIGSQFHEHDWVPGPFGSQCLNPISGAILRYDLTCPAAIVPDNDECDDAIALTLLTSTPFDGVCATPSAFGVDDDLWFSFTPSCASPHRIQVVVPGDGAIVEVFSGCAGSPVASSDGLDQIVLILDDAAAGVTYRVRVAGFPGPELGAGSIVVAPHLPNDGPDSPTDLVLVDGADIVVAFSNTHATTTGGPMQSCPSGQIHRDLWYRVTPSTSANLTVSTCGLDPAFLVRFAVYEADTLEPIGCSTDFCQPDVGNERRLNPVVVIGGEDYLIRVGSSAANLSGCAAFTVGYTPIPVCPPYQAPPPPPNQPCSGNNCCPLQTYEISGGVADGMSLEWNWEIRSPQMATAKGKLSLTGPLHPVQITTELVASINAASIELAPDSFVLFNDLCDATLVATQGSGTHPVTGDTVLANSFSIRLKNVVASIVCENLSLWFGCNDEPFCQVEIGDACVCNPSITRLALPGNDCNGNGIDDLLDVLFGNSLDLNNNGIPDECEVEPCPADLNGDGVVDGADLGIMLTSWGAAGGPADLNGDGIVDGADLGILLASWGACP